MAEILTSSGVTFKTVTTPNLPSTLDGLNLGYYENDTTGEQLINKSLNVTGLADTTGWTAHLGGKVHNLIDSFINFNPSGSTAAKFDIVDRSNATIFAQAARDSVFYDSTDRTTTSIFHISELDYDTMQTYYNTLYAERFFSGYKENYGNKDFIFVFLAYATQKTGAELTKVLKYIGYE